MYQIEAQLGGDLFREPPPGVYSQQVRCPRCSGTGTVAIVAALILAIAIAVWKFGT